MDATTVEDLFYEILEEVFSWLSADDVKNCELVCKEWNNVISSSSSIMKKFELQFHLDIDPELQNELQGSYSTRKYQNMEVEIGPHILLPQSPGPIFPTFDLSQVKNLTFYGKFGENETVILSKLLSRMPLLQELDVTVLEAHFDDPNLPIVSLPKLKKFTLHQASTNGNLLKLVKTSKVTDLKYTESQADYLADNKIETTTEFIKGQEGLTNVTISSFLLMQMLERHDFSEMRHLELLNIYPNQAKISETAQENLMKLLLSNAKSLSTLKIPGEMISKDLFKTIFSALRKLTTLQIVGNVDDSGCLWMDNLSPKRSLKHLTLTGGVMNDKLMKILELLPNIETIQIWSCNATFLSQVAKFNRRLVMMEMFELKGSIATVVDVKFRNLTWLKLRETVEGNSLQLLLSVCPKLVTLELWVEQSSQEEINIFIEVLLQKKTLKHQTFTVEHPILCGLLFDKLKVNYGFLRSVSFKSMQGDIITIAFPENRAEWDVEEQNARLKVWMSEQ